MPLDEHPLAEYVELHGATTRQLDGRALHRAIGTKDAAVTCLGPKQDMTIGALVEEEACIGGHGLRCHEGALWTSEGRLQNGRWMHLGRPTPLRRYAA